MGQVRRTLLVLVAVVGAFGWASGWAGASPSPHPGKISNKAAPAASSSGANQAAKPAAKATALYYLSLGDSYSVGYQPDIDGTGGAATAGYTAYVAKKEHMVLENFGCGGATSSSLLNSLGCTESGYGPPAASDAVDYNGITQEQAAVNFIDAPANYGRVGLITVSIGGNDFGSCSTLACLEAALSAITANVGVLITDLNSALNANGDTAKIVGLTYPDVLLGSYVNPGGTSGQSSASTSVLAFDDFINPTLRTVYTTSVPNGVFVDVTQAPYKLATAGDDTPLTTTARLKSYGVVPAAVWEICKLTYDCVLNNGHSNAKGYDFIGRLVVGAL